MKARSWSSRPLRGRAVRVRRATRRPQAKGTPVLAERVSAHRSSSRSRRPGSWSRWRRRTSPPRSADGSPRCASRKARTCPRATSSEIDRERRELELANERAMVAGARSEIAQEKRELERIRTLHKSEAASQSQLDAASTRMFSAEAKLAAAEAKLGMAKLALRNASVAAPFAGMVARRFVSAGDHVAEASRCSIWSRSTRSRSSSISPSATPRASRSGIAWKCASRRIRTRSSTRPCTSCRRGSTRRRARCA